MPFLTAQVVTFFLIPLGLLMIVFWVSRRVDDFYIDGHTFRGRLSQLVIGAAGTACLVVPAFAWMTYVSSFLTSNVDELRPAAGVMMLGMISFVLMTINFVSGLCTKR